MSAPHLGLENSHPTPPVSGPWMSPRKGPTQENLVKTLSVKRGHLNLLTNSGI